MWLSTTSDQNNRKTAAFLFIFRNIKNMLTPSPNSHMLCSQHSPDPSLTQPSPKIPTAYSMDQHTVAGGVRSSTCLFWYRKFCKNMAIPAHLHPVYSCPLRSRSELSSSNRDLMAWPGKMKIFTLWPFTEKGC